MEHSIEIEGLNKSFGSVRAVRDLSFHVKTGELFAFLGVNGAGKSTTISILCGQLRKDSGRVTVCGESVDGDLGKITRRLGVVFQDSVLDQVLSVRDNLQSRAALYGMLSGGQRRRIDIARALLHRPEILILDEPTTGLDPQTRRLLWNVVQDLRRREKMTVFLTTHYMEEAADADYVVILDSGSIAAEGTPLQLKNTYTGDFVTLYGVTEEQAAVLGMSCETLRDAVRVSVPDTAAATRMIVAKWF